MKTRLHRRRVLRVRRATGFFGTPLPRTHRFFFCLKSFKRSVTVSQRYREPAGRVINPGEPPENWSVGRHERKSWKNSVPDTNTVAGRFSETKRSVGFVRTYTYTLHNRTIAVYKCTVAVSGKTRTDKRPANRRRPENARGFVFTYGTRWSFETSTFTMVVL